MTKAEEDFWEKNTFEEKKFFGERRFFWEKKKKSRNSYSYNIIRWKSLL